jgi:hypothetical protein
MISEGNKSKDSAKKSDAKMKSGESNSSGSQSDQEPTANS